MPELAEVEHSRKQWDAGLNSAILAVQIPRKDVRVFRGIDTDVLRESLTGKKLIRSEASGKQMLFEFSGGCWLGIHLGMSGELRCDTHLNYAARKHDHLVLQLRDRSLIFEDRRHFGRIRLEQGEAAPAWWTKLPPSVVSRAFTVARLSEFLQRRRRTALKPLLLMQEKFPGIGNWMADEILWRARLHPATPSGSLDATGTRRLWHEIRWVSRTAMRIIADDWTYPASWLFTHRWAGGGTCPRCRSELERGTIGGRTTCWCPACQPGSSERGAAKT